MSLKLSILYRGPLSSCNYDCPYCPFAKHHETAVELAEDRRALERFSRWIESRPADDRLSVFFTPWGEALVRRWYRETITRWTWLPRVEQIAAQTNLSWQTDWLGDCDVAKLAMWCTYHPGEVERSSFLAQCRELDLRGVSYSVGMVGRHEDFDEIERMRAELPPSVYLWVNAYKSGPRPYSEAETRRLEAVDPHFRTNTRYHASLGRSCRTGRDVVSVDGDGVIRRCHFVEEPIGHLDEGPPIEAVLRDRPCPNASCGCHIGYVHLEHLEQTSIYGESGRLPRIPTSFLDGTAASPSMGSTNSA